MPYSDNIFDRRVCELIKTCNCRSFLDCGAGAGKYGDMVRRFCPDAVVHAVEIDEEYIDRFRLRDIYHEVICASVVDIARTHTGLYDCVILGDILEHLPKSDGIDVVDAFYHTCSLVIAVYPVGFYQIGAPEHRHETHRSRWSIADFADIVTEFRRDVSIELAVMNGLKTKWQR